MREKLLNEMLRLRPDLAAEYQRLKLSLEKRGIKVVEGKTQAETEALLGRKFLGEAFAHYSEELDTIFLFGVFGRHPIVLFEEAYHRDQAKRYSPEALSVECSEAEAEAFRCLLEIEAEDATEEYAIKLNCSGYQEAIRKRRQMHVQCLTNLGLNEESSRQVITTLFSYV